MAARTLVVVTGAATMTAMALLSTGPWRAPGGYVGHSFAIQFAALCGLVALGLAALPVSLRARRSLRRVLRWRRPGAGGA
ncbi:hypothetical protein GQ85_33175 [Rhodococcus rhodochrous]|nr:hypothetical protein GQ85_33175 [Rhodococcus rhodochrous]